MFATTKAGCMSLHRIPVGWTQKAKIPYSVRRTSTSWFEENKGEERQHPPSSPTVKDVALQDVCGFVFYISLTAPHLSWPVNTMWLCFGFLVPINSSPFVAGLKSHNRCNGLLSFQIPPKRMDNSIHFPATFKPWVWCSVGSHFVLA